MATETVPAPIDLSEHQFAPECDRGCGQPAAYIAKGCMDKEPTMLCQAHYKRGIEVIVNYIRLYQQTNKRVLICGDCHRPILSLDTHLESRPIP